MPTSIRLFVLALVVVAAVFWAVQAGRGSGAGRRTLLLTGFGPFGEVDVNPSWEAIRTLEGEEIGGFRVRTARLDVAYADAADQLRTAVRQFAPDAVLCLGVAPGAEIRLEVVARNRDTSGHPDVAGEIRRDAAIREEGPSLLPTRLPVKRLLEVLRAGGYEVRTSEDAGGYLCNHVFYRLMDEVEVPGPAGFVHVPEMKEPWTIERLRDAVRLIVETLGT